MFNSMSKEMRERLSERKVENFNLKNLSDIKHSNWYLLKEFRLKSLRDPNWTEAERTSVLDEALSGDHQHLINTLQQYSND